MRWWESILKWVRHPIPERFPQPDPDHKNLVKGPSNGCTCRWTGRYPGEGFRFTEKDCPIHGTQTKGAR